MSALLSRLASMLAILSSLLGFNQTPPLATATLAIGNVNIIVEIADTDATRAQGLSNRLSLPENTGMLFVFDTTDNHSFWMKDMNFPLDIVWLNDNWRVVDITANILPRDFPKIYQPRSPVRYVLEVNAGFIAAHRITIGTQVVSH